jgi:uncharacterized protein (TIGR00730 family)
MPHIGTAEGDKTRDQGDEGDNAQNNKPPLHANSPFPWPGNLFRKMAAFTQPRSSMTKPQPSICVFCGSSFGNDPRFREVARAVGEGIGRMGCSLVFGGGSLGLMGDVARAAQEAGAKIQGIIPAFLQALEGIEPVSAEEKLIVTPHLQERKAVMLQMSDAFMVLPGGLGTFDEFFEVATEAQLGVHRKPIIVVNVDGFFDALDAMLDQIVAKGFAKPAIMELYHLADGPEAALLALQQALT